MLAMRQEPGQDARAGELLLWIGLGLWVLILLCSWPLALTFGDEVGYLGQAKLFLQGHVRPSHDSAGLWFPGPHGEPLVKYPLMPAILLAPLLAVHPPAVFLVSAVATLALVVVAERALRSWGRAPGWGLILLAHPTISLLSRTAMQDVAFSAAAVGAWWALTRRRLAWTCILLAFVTLIKAPGAAIAGLLVAGEALRWWRSSTPRDPTLWRRLGLSVIAIGVGLCLAAGLTMLSTGKAGLGYAATLGDAPFSAKYLATTGRSHALSLLICPPLLIAGVLPYWRRRDFGPLLAIAGFAAIMSVYFFIDVAPSWAVGVVLSQRLILPVVSFLLIGYADLMASLAGRWRGAAKWGPVAAMLLALLTFSGVSYQHLSWQRSAKGVLEAAASVAAAAGTNELALTYGASKVGMLYSGPLRMFVPETRAKVVLCTEASPSYRRPDFTGSCAFPGYRLAESINGFQILTDELGSSAGLR